MTADVTVIGPGSIGGAAAGVLLDAGHDVVLCARQPFDRVELRGPDGSMTHPATVLTEPADAVPTPWVLLAVKGYQTPGAAPWLERTCSADTTVAVLQNGVEHITGTEPHVGGASILPVVVMLPAEKLEPGVIEQTRPGQLIVRNDSHGQAFAELFPTDGLITVSCVDDFDRAMWQKLMLNAAVGAISALTLRRNSVLGDEGIPAVARAIMAEVVAVARAQDIELPADAPDWALDRIDGSGDHWSSITQDRKAGRRMEWDARNGVVGRIGRTVGVETPLNDAMAALLRACEGSST